MLPQAAAEFTYEPLSSNGIILKITIKKGTPVIYLDNFKIESLTLTKGEYEVVLPRNTEIKFSDKVSSMDISGIPFRILEGRIETP